MHCNFVNTLTNSRWELWSPLEDEFTQIKMRKRTVMVTRKHQWCQWQMNRNIIHKTTKQFPWIHFFRCLLTSHYLLTTWTSHQHKNKMKITMKLILMLVIDNFMPEILAYTNTTSSLVEITNDIDSSETEIKITGNIYHNNRELINLILIF